MLPDRFEIATIFDQPRYTVREKNDGSGHKVNISFHADYSRLEKFLFSSHPEDFLDLKILKAEALPLKVNHLSQIFDEESIVTWDVIFQVNEVHLEYHFTNEFDRSTIRSLFEGPFVFAKLDYEMQCGGQITSAYCDSEYATIPLFNQFLGDIHQQDFELYEDYKTLHYFKNYYFTFNPFLRLASDIEIDEFIKSKLYSGSLCQNNLVSIEATVCEVIKRYSIDNSYSQSIETIEDQIREFIELSTSDTFILGEADFSIIGDGSVPIEHCSEWDIFCPII